MKISWALIVPEGYEDGHALYGYGRLYDKDMKGVEELSIAVDTETGEVLYAVGPPIRYLDGRLITGVKFFNPPFYFRSYGTNVLHKLPYSREEDADEPAIV